MRLCVKLVIGLLACGGVHAESLVVVHPGVMCASASALAQLTLPDGSSRAGPGDVAVKQQGGCLDLVPGARVEVQSARRNTSIVRYDAGDGRGAQTYVAPNVDLGPGGTSGGAPAGGCIAYQVPVTLEGTITLGSSYGEDPQTGVVGRSHWQQLTLARPICTRASADGWGEAEQGVRSMAVTWFRGGKWPFAVGQHVMATGTLAGRTRTTEDTAVLFEVQSVVRR